MHRHIPQPADDNAWILRVTGALDAVRSLYGRVSRENGDTSRLIRQMRYLKRALAAFLEGNRSRARGLLAAVLALDDGPHLENGQAGKQTAGGPAAQKTASDCTQSDGGSALG